MRDGLPLSWAWASTYNTWLPTTYHMDAKNFAWAPKVSPFMGDHVYRVLESMRRLLWRSVDDHGARGHTLVLTHDSRGHPYTWTHTSCATKSRLHAVATWTRVTLAIVGKHNAGPCIKVKKSLKDFLYFY